MRIWLTSDTHFGHRKLVEYGRPDNFEDRIWSRFKVLKKGDLLIHLGDFCIGNETLWHNRLKELPCRKTLIRGNHDTKTITWYMENGWDNVCDSMQLIFMGKNFVFSHCPMTPYYWFNQTKFQNYDWNIHGHTHGNGHRDGEFTRDSRQIGISLELNEYRPVNFENLVKNLWNKQN